MTNKHQPLFAKRPLTKAEEHRPEQRMLYQEAMAKAARRQELADAFVRIRERLTNAVPFVSLVGVVAILAYVMWPSQ